MNYEIPQVRDMKPEAAREVVEGLYEGGVNFVSMLPESELLTAQHAVLKDGRFISLPVTNENSGVAACAGAWAGGKKPAMIMGSAGFAVASYALIGTCIRHGIPVLLIISSRMIGDNRWIFSIWNAHALQPGLDAMKFPYTEVKRISDVRQTISKAAKTCFAWMKPVAVILEEEVVFS